MGEPGRTSSDFIGLRQTLSDFVEHLLGILQHHVCVLEPPKLHT